MYDLAEVRRLTDDWWRGLTRHLEANGLNDVPHSLSRPDDVSRLWRSPGLLFSQTCGYPYVKGLREWVRLVATPAYTARGCVGARYCALIIVQANQTATRLADLEGVRVAVNGFDSHSGWNAFRAAMASVVPSPELGVPIVAGAHRASLAMVRGGEADVCSIDCVTYGLIERYASDETEGTRVLAETPHAPGLPYVTSRTVPADTLSRLRDGVAAAFADPNLSTVRDGLLLDDFEVLDDRDYAEITALEAKWATNKQSLSPSFQ